MPFSAYFYALLTQFALSVYFDISLIDNMLFSIYIVSEKNIPDIFDSKLETNYQILITFSYEYS